jgi:hypothetical protein
VRKIKVVLLLTMLLLFNSLPAIAEGCDLLQNSTPDELVSYLNGIAADDGNAGCITFAIGELGKHRYEPAITVLVRFLDFRRPLDSREKQGLYLHIQGIAEIYPAANALEEIGKSALPAVLDTIKTESTSEKARENAVSVWMEIYRSEAPKGIAVLRQEADLNKGVVVKRNLEWSLSKAVTWCNPPDKAQCKAAAKIGDAK